MDEVISIARKHRFDELLKDVDGVTNRTWRSEASHVYHLYVIQHPNRDALSRCLREIGVATGVALSLTRALAAVLRDPGHPPRLASYQRISRFARAVAANVPRNKIRASGVYVRKPSRVSQLSGPNPHRALLPLRFASLRLRVMKIQRKATKTRRHQEVVGSAPPVSTARAAARGC